MDDPTFRLIVKLQLEDAMAMKSNLAAAANGRGRKSDAQQAIEAYEQELRSLDHFNNDRILATSNDRAVRLDQRAIQRCRAQEEMAARDHRLALDLSRGVVNLDGNGRDGGNNQHPNANPPPPAPMNPRAPVNNRNAPVRGQGTFGGFGNNNNHQAPMASQTPTNTRASPSNLLPLVQAAAVPPPPPGYGRGTIFGFGRNNHPSPRMSPASPVTSQASVNNHQAPVNGMTPDNGAAPSKVAAKKEVSVSNQAPANRQASSNTRAPHTSGRPLAEQTMMKRKASDMSDGTQVKSGVDSKKRKVTEVESVECCTCSEEFKPTEVMVAPCGDKYCRSCISRLFRLTLKDQSLYPIRCCRLNIELEAASEFLGPELVEEFRAKALEYDTPNPTYCSQTWCGKFIPPTAHVSEGAVCQSCSTRTCRTCKTADHSGKDCPKDTALQEVLKVAEQQNWKRCHSCRRMIELNTGCNHITCVCRAQWCYLCGTAWPQGENSHCSKGCPLFEEEDLVRQAEAQVAANPAAHAGPALARAAAVAEAAQNLRENHACSHPGWERRVGENVCDHCNQTLARFLWECSTCATKACNRCKANRI